MKITITLDTSGPDFDNDRFSGAHSHVAEKLATIATWFYTDGPFEGDLYDSSGNTIGTVTVEGKL